MTKAWAAWAATNSHGLAVPTRHSKNLSRNAGQGYLPGIFVSPHFVIADPHDSEAKCNLILIHIS